MSSVCDISVCHSISLNLVKHSLVAAGMDRNDLVERKNTLLAYVLV